MKIISKSWHLITIFPKKYFKKYFQEIFQKYLKIISKSWHLIPIHISSCTNSKSP